MNDKYSRSLTSIIKQYEIDITRREKELKDIKNHVLRLKGQTHLIS